MPPEARPPNLLSDTYIVSCGEDPASLDLDERNLQRPVEDFKPDPTETLVSLIGLSVPELRSL